MSVRRSRASLCSVTRICCRMISADVIGRRARPGEAGPEVWLSVRTIVGVDRLIFRPRAFLIRLHMRPPPPLAPATGDDTGDDTSPSNVPRVHDAVVLPDERQDMKKISYAVSRSSTGPSATTLPKGQSRSAAAKSSSAVSVERVAEEFMETERNRR